MRPAAVPLETATDTGGMDMPALCPNNGRGVAATTGRVEDGGTPDRQRMDRLVAESRWTDSDDVFATMLGKPLHAATSTRCFQDALDRAGLPRVRLHDLRHSATTFLLAQGITLEDVKNQLGHSTIVLTSNTYGHVLEQRQREIARVMDAVLGG
jgi:integrase